MDRWCTKCGTINHAINIIDHGMFWMTLQRIFDDVPETEKFREAVLEVKGEITKWYLLVDAAILPHDGPTIYPEFYLIVHIREKGIMTLYYDVGLGDLQITV